MAIISHYFTEFGSLSCHNYAIRSEVRPNDPNFEKSSFRQCVIYSDILRDYWERVPAHGKRLNVRRKLGVWRRVDKKNENHCYHLLSDCLSVFPSFVGSWQLRMHCNLRPPEPSQRIPALITTPCQIWSRWAYPLPYYSVFAANTFTLRCDLDLWP